ncbi:MAG: crossover junction endodeoxyribonuclease RuvC [Armatimonadetes bacterium]|nr:crossover junction endodeoxyribonuclease RuvC [Armatimonadota bacterium]
MRILGVDPGLQCTGYGLIEALGGTLRLIEGGVIRTDPHAPLALRLRTLYEGLGGILREYEPGCVVVEELYTKYAHPRTAILMGHARGMALLAAGEHGVTVVGYPASLIKRALTGNGRATKAQVGRMVCQVLGLEQAPSPDDVTDALALALCHASPTRSRLTDRGGRR